VTRRRADEAALRADEAAFVEAAFVPEARTAPTEAAPTEAAEASEPADAPGKPDPPDAPDDDLDGDGPAAAGDTTRPETGLDERSRQLLAFERGWWKHAGAKEQAIRESFGLSATRYYQLLNALLDDPAALAEDPVLVRRLRRLRASRSRRSA
jgi:hypothetical protein